MAVSMIDGPNGEMVCLRAGQSVGKVKDRYMSVEKDGDALVGRATALLQANADQFDVLPPHFQPADLEELYRVGWNVLIPGHVFFPVSAQRAIRMTMASFFYHYNSGYHYN